jgi:hypothetical protein
LTKERTFVVKAKREAATRVCDECLVTRRASAFKIKLFVIRFASRASDLKKRAKKKKKKKKKNVAQSRKNRKQKQLEIIDFYCFPR